MKISKMPPEILSLVKHYGLSIPNACYMNSFLLVMQAVSSKELDLSYVLVNITYNNKTYPHAVIKHHDQFYDPTLEPQGLIDDVSYSLVKEFKTDEIAKLMCNRFSESKIKNMFNGKEVFWPLIQVSTNEFDFIDDGSPEIFIEPKTKQSKIRGLFKKLKIIK
jgi:hypothetical protein